MPPPEGGSGNASKFHENVNFMKLRGSEVCVKQDHFTHGSCSIPGSTTWWSRPFYCEKIRSDPQPPWSIWWFFSENRMFWGVFKLCFSSYFQNLLKFAIFVDFGLIVLIFTTIFLNFLKVQNMQFWAKITGRAYVVDPGIEHEPRRFFDAFWRSPLPTKFQDSRFRSKSVRLLRYKEGDWT